MASESDRDGPGEPDGAAADGSVPADGDGEAVDADAVQQIGHAADAVEAIGTEPAAPQSPGGLRSVLRTSLVTGAAVVVPLLITVVVLVLVASLVSDAIGPFVVALSWLPVEIGDQLLLEIATLCILLLAMLVVGYVSAYHSSHVRLVGRIERFIESVPGVGAVYKSFNQMSKLLVDSDSQSFKEVVLVEYPTEGSYVIAFRTGTPSDAVADATGHDEMVTLFMPMGPNPVLGGFVLHVSADRVRDVDLTVEEGIRSIVTSGVATGTRRERAD